MGKDDPVLVVGQGLASRTLAWALAEAGLPARKADDGIEALALLGGGTWSAIVLSGAPGDVPIPDLIPRIRAGASNGSIPVVVVAPPTDLALQDLAWRAGATDVLQLRADPGEVVAVVRHLRAQFYASWSS